MSFLFGKKAMAQAPAEVLEDGRAKMTQELKKGKYSNYAGAEPMLEIAVRVLPENETPFEAQMKAGLAHCNLLLPGVRVLVQYEPGKNKNVRLDDQLPAILQRNPQLIKKTGL